MTAKLETNHFIQDLEKVSRMRGEVADGLSSIVQILTQGEADGEKQSGKLGLEREIDDLTKATAIANSFRDYVLGLGDTFEADFLHYKPALS
jgi:hypothetical protein